MTSRSSQNKPPRSPLSKSSSVSGLQPDKRRRIGAERMAAARGGGTARGRQPFAAVTNRQDSVASDVGGTEASETESMEFTKEGVEDLLNEKFKGKKFDHKAKMEHTADYMRRLKLCLRWFQEVEERNAQEKEKLQGALDSSEGKCRETESAMRKKEEELNALITDLQNQNASLQETLQKEVSEKSDALELYRTEKEARVAGERLHDSLREKLGRAEQEISDANQRVTYLQDMNNNAREYTTSLQQYNGRLQSDLASANDSLKRAENEKVMMVQNLSTLRINCSTLQDRLTSSKDALQEAVHQKEALQIELDRLRRELQQVREDRDRHLMNVQDLTAEMVRYKELTGKSVDELDKLTLKSNVLEQTCSSQREQICLLQHELAAATEKLKMADLTAVETRTEYEQQKQVISELKDRLQEAEQKLAEGENLRKKLHNTILELKGNIRVFCRVRPLLPEDNNALETPVVSYPTSVEGQDRGIELIQNGQKYPFTFDKVFSHESSQQDVFVEISQLVQSALDGYKVCIFAYGQTGSGKTYTMMGIPDVFEKKGLIPRSLEQIFQTSQSLQAQGWKYKMQASMLEIYNETIRDLLSPNRSSSSDVARTENGGLGKQYHIKHDANGNTHVSDLTIIDVCSINEVSSLLRQAAQSRSVGKTLMNEQSSRSHFVFTLRISGVNERTEQQVQGVLNLIDLAGSERLSKSGATGDRLKETQAINKSLSSLSDVIFSLAKKEDHVPFRNSKLTYLLQPCLGGDSKTLMFVNLSPEPSSLGESICSLRFAARVNSCEIGIPRRQTSSKASDSRLSYG